MGELNVGIYLDFANLSISAANTYPHLERPLDVEPLMDYAATKGTITIKRAYGDWTQQYATSYVRMLVDHGFEMRHVPIMNSQGKNASDLQMAIEILNDIQYLPLDIFVLGSGDTDFVPLTRNVIAKGKQIHVIGFELSVGPVLKKNCTIFKSMDELLGHADERENGSYAVKYESASRLSPPAARNLLLRLSRTWAMGEKIHLTELKQQLLRMEPSFSEKKWGFPSFKPFIESFVGDIIEKIETDQRTGHPLVVFRDASLIKSDTTATNDRTLTEDVLHFLEFSVNYSKDRDIRLALAQQFIECFKSLQMASILEIADFISKNLSFDYPIAAVKKFVFALGEGRAMHSANVTHDYSLYLLPQQINEGLDSPEEVEIIYRSRVIELVKNKFPKIEDDELLRLMNLGGINTQSEPI